MQVHVVSGLLGRASPNHRGKGSLPPFVPQEYPGNQSLHTCKLCAPCLHRAWLLLPECGGMPWGRDYVSPTANSVLNKGWWSVQKCRKLPGSQSSKSIASQDFRKASGQRRRSLAKQAVLIARGLGQLGNKPFLGKNVMPRRDGASL